MNAGRQSDPAQGKARTTLERTSERELVVTRTVDGPARIVFEAWTKPELFQRWWVPKSCGLSLISFEADVRSGGAYRLVMGHPSSEQPMAFFGRYLEVTPHSRLVWTNDEGGEAGGRDHGDLRGEGWRDTGHRARALSFDRSARRGHGVWQHKRVGRAIRAARRPYRHLGREGLTAMEWSGKTAGPTTCCDD
jgi:uncharacterized protein YndB with AHSA1/START domain